jgi:sugar lactone lactonase YvrE
MLHRRPVVVAFLALVVLTGGTTASSADRGRGDDGCEANAAERLFTLQPDPAGNPEGVAFDKRSKDFFVSITADGAIYRGTLDSDTVSPFIRGGAGRAAIGLEIRRGKLYVAGGPTGSITVYDLASGQTLATFQTGTGGFLNDLVVTRRGDVFVTDSSVPSCGT